MSSSKPQNRRPKASPIQRVSAEAEKPAPQKIRAIVQITCGVGGSTPELAAKATRDVVLRWLSGKQKVRIPPLAWEGQPFETDFAEGRQAIVKAFENI